MYDDHSQEDKNQNMWIKYIYGYTKAEHFRIGSLQAHKSILHIINAQINVMYLVLLYFHHHFIDKCKLSLNIFFLLNYLKCLYFCMLFRFLSLKPCVWSLD